MKDDTIVLRWGILGCGHILGKICQAFRLSSHATLAAVSSRDVHRARVAAAEWGIPRAHGNYEALINDPETDVVFNALHNGLHCEWSVRALEAGKHVLCEKPLACSGAEVERMFAAAHANGRWLMEGFMYRFHPQMTAILERVRRGDLGRIVHIRSQRIAHGREPGNPRYRLDAGGGALLDVGCYCVNFSRMVACTEPTRAMAHARFDQAGGVDLMLAGTLEFESGAIAQFVCGFEGEPSFAAEIVGTEANIYIPHPWMPPSWPAELVLTRGSQSETVRLDEPGVPQHILSPFALEIDEMCTCVRENRPPQFPLGVDAEQDSCGNMRVIDALLTAARSGNAVGLSGV